MIDDRVKDIIKSLEIKHNITKDSENLTTEIRELKDKVQCLYLGGSNFIKFKYMKKSHATRIYIRKSVIADFELHFSGQERVLKSETVYSAFDYLKKDDSFYKDIEIYIDCYIKSYQPTSFFACCSRYKECSKDKQCIHPDKLYSKGCWYRLNIEKGNIFY